VYSEKNVDAAQTSRKILALLEGLKRTSVGTVIYDQVERIVVEQEEVQTRVNHGYTSLLHLLLEAYAREPSPDQITRINARLIQLHRPPAITSPMTGDTAPGSIEQQLRQATAGTAKAAPEPHAEEPPAPPASPEKTKAEKEMASETVESPPEAEHRVNKAYRQHLDRKRDEIEKLQEALTKSVSEAITQNREFGALLQIELGALQQAEGSKEIENLQQILIGGIEELIHGQNALDTKLHRTGGYLKLIKDDSQRLHEELSKVRLLSLTDEFTGLPNRRAFMRQLQDEISRGQRYGVPLALAMIDLDGFKAINDVHGHAAGDAVLRCYATEVLTVLRHHDMVARYGGEEFAALLPNTTQEGAVAAITKVKNRVQEIHCEYDSQLLPLPTFSTGVTLYMPGETPLSVIDRADRALYRAKRLGRNRIEVELPAPKIVPEDIKSGNGG
jgi:diguanylate cyclase (GGDEF)-like protein